jgi:hypothetical protein
MSNFFRQNFGGVGFEYSETITAGSTTSPIYVWDARGPVTLAALPGGGGTVNVQYTVSTVADIDAATATWHDWPGGAVSADTVDAILVPVTAVRGVAATADGVIEVRY